MSSVRLHPLQPAELLALFSPGDFPTEISGMAVSPGLSDMLRGGEVSTRWLDSIRALTQSDAWRHGSAICLSDPDRIVGMAGFKGPPDDDGVVEIAYGVAAEFERRGIATAAAAKLIEFARQHESVTTIRARTKHDHAASIRVLEKSGFTYAHDVDDPDDGLVMEWIFNPAPG
jgi:RimJ/RimL family protein N-acetyltransferase